MEFKEKIWPLKDQLYRMAMRLLNDRNEAEDVVQEVMVKLWQQGKDLSLIKNLETWSYKLTKNHALDKLKSAYNKRKTAWPEHLSITDRSAKPDTQIESKDGMAYIKEQMQKLPEQHRLVMHLRDIEEMSYQEISEALDMSMAQVKSNLFRARKAMRAALLKNKQHG